MKDTQYQKYRDFCLTSPRMTSLIPHFEAIASGSKQRPNKIVLGNSEFLSQSPDLRRYHEIFHRNMGIFYEHYCASIPFLLEEQCRVGVALGKLAQLNGSASQPSFSFYEASAADGTNARTLAEYSDGLIQTLTDSPTKSNEINFHKRCSHDYSSFYLGPFVDITLDFLASQPNLSPFQDGFDCVYESTAFQFYGPNRQEQIGYMKQLLKEDGLMIFLEKLRHPDNQEYQERERLKDDRYKSRYFSPEEISWKQSSMLDEMILGQADLNHLLQAIRSHFDYAYLIWNSANFYELVASNSAEKIRKFINFLPEAYIPEEFCFEQDMPRLIS